MGRETTKNLCNSCLRLIPDESTKCPFCGSVVEVKQPSVSEGVHIPLSRRIGDVLIMAGILTVIFLVFGLVAAIAFQASIGVGLLVGGLSMSFVCLGYAQYVPPSRRQLWSSYGPFGKSWAKAYPPAESSIEVEYSASQDGFLVSAVMGLIIFFISLFIV